MDEVTSGPRSHWTHAFAPTDCDSVLYAASFGLALYIRQKLAQKPRITELSTRRRLLDFALHSWIQHERLQMFRQPSLAVVQALLESGADPNDDSMPQDESRNVTPWHRYLHGCYRSGFSGSWPVARLLLLHGAHANACVQVDLQTKDSGSRWKGLGDKYEPVYASVRECLQNLFLTDEEKHDMD